MTALLNSYVITQFHHCSKLEWKYCVILCRLQNAFGELEGTTCSLPDPQELSRQHAAVAYGYTTMVGFLPSGLPDLPPGGMQSPWVNGRDTTGAKAKICSPIQLGVCAARTCIPATQCALCYSQSAICPSAQLSHYHKQQVVSGHGCAPEAFGEALVLVSQ